MNLVLLGIGLAIGIAVTAVGLVVMFRNKKLYEGVIVALAGIAVVGGVMMIDAQLNYNKNNPSNGTSAPVGIESPTVNEDPSGTVTPPAEETPLPATAEPTEVPTPTEEPTATPTPTPEPGRYIEVHKSDWSLVKPDNWNGSTVYLTFDDGPSVVTGEILDALKKHNVKATFFVIGNEISANDEKYIKRAIEEGHTVGIHAYTHEYSVIYTSVDDYLSDFNRIDQLLKDKFNYKALVFRFPGGSSNETSKRYCKGIMTELTQLMPERGYSYFDWNVSPEDAMGTLEPDVIAERVLNGLSKNRTENVVLMHDFDQMSPSAQALDKIITNALADGFAFDRLTPETTPVRHTVAN